MPAVDLGLYDCLQEVKEDKNSNDDASSSDGDYDFANV